MVPSAAISRETVWSHQSACQTYYGTVPWKRNVCSRNSSNNLASFTGLLLWMRNNRWRKSSVAAFAMPKYAKKKKVLRNSFCSLGAWQLLQIVWGRNPRLEESRSVQGTFSKLDGVTNIFFYSAPVHFPAPLHRAKQSSNYVRKHVALLNAKVLL